MLVPYHDPGGYAADVHGAVGERGGHEHEVPGPSQLWQTESGAGLEDVVRQRVAGVEDEWARAHVQAATQRPLEGLRREHLAAEYSVRIAEADADELHVQGLALKAFGRCPLL